MVLGLSQLTKFYVQFFFHCYTVQTEQDIEVINIFNVCKKVLEL